jgi:hypothetical protein
MPLHFIGASPMYANSDTDFGAEKVMSSPGRCSPRVGEDALSDEAIQCGSVLVAGQEEHILDGEQAASREKALMHDVTFRGLRKRHDVSGCASGQCA